MFKKNDLILVSVLLVLCLSAIIFINYYHKPGSEVVITLDGSVYKTLPLDEDTSFTINSSDGGYNVITIKDGSVSMTEANCPQQICVNHKSISYNNESIVCLPHKLVITIKSSDDNNIDAIAK